jgi:hypothetical protein
MATSFASVATILAILFNELGFATAVSPIEISEVFCLRRQSGAKSQKINDLVVNLA